MIDQITLPKSNTLFVEQKIEYPQWLDSVNYHRECFVNNNASTWLLYCEDAFQFSVLFFALLTANKKIILPQNGTTNQLHLCMALADGYAGNTKLNIENSISFSASNNLPIKTPLTISPETEITLFTSGSTGEAKAIEKTFQHLLTEVIQLEQCFGEKLASSTIVSTVSHQHIYGLLVKLIWPIWLGRDVILQPYEYPEHLCHDISKYHLHNITLISSPAHYHRLIKDNVYIDIKNKITALFSSGGPLSESASQQLKTELGQSPVEIYGSTETGGIAWRQKCNGKKSSWLPFSDINIAEENESQCLKIKSPYFKHQGWYITDDQVQIATDGSFELLGRVDRIIKIEEKRVSLDHVQHCLKSLGYIDDAYCLTQQNKRGLQIVAVIVLTEEAKKALLNSRNLIFNRKIKSSLLSDLEVIAIPKKFRYLPSLPYNSSGKLNKVAMEKLFE